jgi:hypothetical protein
MPPRPRYMALKRQRDALARLLKEAAFVAMSGYDTDGDCFNPDACILHTAIPRSLDHALADLNRKIREPDHSPVDLHRFTIRHIPSAEEWESRSMKGNK